MQSISGRASFVALLVVPALLGHPGPAKADQTCPASVQVSSALSAPCGAPGVDVVGLQQAGVYMWNTFIALNWPAATGSRGEADSAKSFGAADSSGILLPTAWQTMRAKVELYPGNASETVPPHGVTLDSANKPNNPPRYGYGAAPKYLYSPASTGTADGSIPACSGQPPVRSAAYVNLDETTQIGNNQLYAGILPATDPKGLNSAPQLLRYTVKMNETFWEHIVANRFWYSADGAAPLDQARENYQKAYAKRLAQIDDPAKYPGTIVPDEPFVTFVSRAQNPDPLKNSIEIKAAWRPLTATEMTSGRFFTAHVRYYETDTKSRPCYREDVWGLASMHVIAFTPSAPWGVWSTFEQADGLLTADGKPVEDDDGALTGNLPAGTTPTDPALTSDPSQPQPVVWFATPGADYCATPGNRLYFRENPQYGYKIPIGKRSLWFPSLPSAGKICVNARWQTIPSEVVALNKTAHGVIESYLQKQAGTTGPVDSPWLHYRLTNVQPQPVDYDNRIQPNTGAKPGEYGPFVDSSEESYFLADALIETDYSLGNFTGDLVQGAPSDTILQSGKLVDYVNVALMKFQSNGFGSLDGKMRMGGCIGCHGFANSIGQNFSFALGSNPDAPEPVDAFATQATFRDYLTVPRSLKLFH